MSKKEICHVCKKEKKPYIKFMNMDVLNMIEHDQAREGGPICERCDNYFAFTGELKDSTEEEYKLAKEAHIFSHRMLKWWQKDNKMCVGDGPYFSEEDEEKNKRSWGGTFDIAKWYREEYCSQKTSKRSEQKNPAHFCIGTGCKKFLGHRGFCSTKCHDSHYDGLDSFCE